MPNFFDFYGYGDYVFQAGLSYSYLALIGVILEDNLGILSSMLEIDGHAKFNAVYGFWETVFCLFFETAFIIIIRPTLFGLGLFGLVESLAMHGVYCYIVYYKKRWLDP